MPPMRWHRLLIAVAAILVAGADARAEMYRYRDPGTGRMKLTNAPPPWMKRAQPPAVPATAESTAAAPETKPAVPGATGSYPLPEHGVLRMNVPAAWRDEVRSGSSALPPTIVFHPASGERFEILVTPFWRAQADAPLPTKDVLRQRLEQAIEGVRPRALEQEIKQAEFVGTGGAGVYFSVTDRTPDASEYKFMTQGILGVRELTVAFTILTNDGEREVVQQALAMLQTAAHDER